LKLEAPQRNVVNAFFVLVVREAHLDRLPIVARLEEGLRLHLATSNIADILVVYLCRHSGHDPRYEKKCRLRADEC